MSTGSWFPHGSARSIWIRPRRCRESLFVPRRPFNARRAARHTRPRVGVHVRAHAVGSRLFPANKAVPLLAPLHLNLAKQLGRFLFTGFNVAAAAGKSENCAKINCVSAQVAVIKGLIRPFLSPRSRWRLLLMSNCCNFFRHVVQPQFTLNGKWDALSPGRSWR